MAYKSTTNITLPADLTRKNVNQTRYEVTEADQEKVTSKLTTQQLEPEENEPSESTTTQTREDFLKACRESHGVTLPDDSYTITLTGKGREEITVPAGRFDTKWSQYKITTDEPRLVSESTTKAWMKADDSGVLVKSESESKSLSGAAETTTDTTVELIELVEP